MGLGWVTEYVALRVGPYQVTLAIVAPYCTQYTRSGNQFQVLHSHLLLHGGVAD